MSTNRQISQFLQKCLPSANQNLTNFQRFIEKTKLYKLRLIVEEMVHILKFGKKFDKEFNKIDKSISSQIVKKLARLKENPETVGKPLLHTKPTLWEFKAEVYRAFYIIQESSKEIWLLSVKHKDECDDYIRRGHSKDVSEF